MTVQTLKAFAITAILFLALAVGAQAAATRIECPLSQVDSGVISPLPSPWYSTPVRGPLVGTRVLIQKNGDKLLSCDYETFRGNLGVVQVAPQGMDCVEDGPSGFTCTSQGVTGQPVQPPSNHPIRTGGSQMLSPTYVMDFDSGNVGGYDGGDIWYNASAPGTGNLEPINGALMRIIDPSSAGYQTCSTVSGYSMQPIDVTLLTPRTTICVSTSEGRFAAFSVLQSVSQANGNLNFNFTSWER